MERECGMKRRKGNLLITVVVLLVVTLMMSSMLALINAQAFKSRMRAENAGVVESYIALANLCADSFVSDIEAMRIGSIPVASVENPLGREITIGTYDEVLQDMQDSLTMDDTTIEEGKWRYVLDDPKLSLDFVPTVNTDFSELAEELLDNATLKIVVASGMTVTQAVDGETIRFKGEDHLYIDDIVFTVTLTKGTTRVVQNYILTNEIFTARFTGGTMTCYISGEKAVCTLESQYVTRNSTGGA